MKTLIFCFTLLLFIPNYISIISSKSLFNLTTDEIALIALKSSFVPNPNSIFLQSNWSTNTPICKWIGVSCGQKHHRVTTLNLSGFGLRGTLAPHLGNLTFLRSFDISSNNFTGALPSELSKLRRLQEINIGANNLTGEIPSWFGALSELRFVYLYNNSFSGGIPASLFNISRLRGLDLSNNNLNGNIPEEIGACPSLESVVLDGNELWGSIPNSIFNVSSMIYISMRFNGLSGKLPRNMCSNTPKLVRFSIAANEFYGEIPRNISNCRELEALELQHNYFNDEIPSEFGSLSMLKYVYLWGNRFTGELPKELSNLSSLHRFLLGNNSFSGGIPCSIFNISTLQQLDLSFNGFSGYLPPNTGVSLFNLEKLYLQNNYLTGPIPSSINNASRLTYLVLQSNSFTGSIPSFSSLGYLLVLLIGFNNLTATREMEFLFSLTSSKYLEIIEITSNPHINGVLPSSIGNLSKSLEFFLAGGTGIQGVIPSEIGNLSSLILLDLNGNELRGSIPETLGNLKRLGKLGILRNRLQGSIPIELCQISSLAELHLQSNELEGPIPECLGEMQSLRIVYLDSNRLNSTIPSTFWNLKGLIYLNLSSNYFSGQISSRIGESNSINGMSFSFNLFSGEIPSSIDGCQSLEKLDLSNNKFGGSIPESLGNIKGLTAVDLSNNSLSGLIPNSLQDLKFLEFLNVSYNRLEGEIPNGGFFSNCTPQSFFHNLALCGATRFEVPPCSDAGRRSRSKNVARLMKYILPPLISAVAILIIAMFLIRRVKRRTVPTPVDSGVGIAWRITSYIELSRATDAFNETNLLGRGSFGSVFKGVLPEGMNIAVKVFNLELEGTSKSFEAESRILSTIRHRNLVRIIGCCTNMEFKALILEFMSNGTLEKWLYSDNYCADILRLLNISIDVAFALEYLHHGNTFPVVHCDIKPHNVLLDEDMTARVADFGISKLFNEGEVMIQTTTLATIGYAAPEYGSEGKVSTSADVYSFGILLLEMFTRRKPTDDMFDGEMSLREWVSQALAANAMNQVYAPALLSEEDRHFVVKEKCVASVFELAMKCLANSPNERITMIEAVGTLKKVKSKLVTEISTRHQQHAITMS